MGRSILLRISANDVRGTATSVGWNVTLRPFRTTLAPTYASFSRREVREYRSRGLAKASVLTKFSRVVG